MPEIPVDADCFIQNVRVYKDYSCLLHLSDVDYNSLGSNKFYKMQMLERKDGKKWYVWSQFGRINAVNPKTREQEFYGRYDAIAYFEKHFYEKTNNKWTTKEFFQQKPGKWSLVKKDQEKEIVRQCA